MRVVGWLDDVDRDVSGWAYDADAPQRSITVTVIVDGVPVARTRTSLVRSDVKEAGHPTSRCGFRERLPTRYLDGEPHDVRVVAGPSEDELDGSPREVLLGEPSPVRRLEPFATETVLEQGGDIGALTRRVTASGRLALLAAHLATPGRSRHLEAHIEALHAIGAGVVCIDTTDRRDKGSGDGADLWLVRENVGWDFASWLAGVAAVRPLLDSADELILVNDSNYGPFVALDELFASPRVQGADAWGVTDSWEIRYHLQSYFIVLRASALRSPALWKYFEEYPFPRSKADVVLSGEVGLTSALHTAGLHVAAAHPYEDVARQWLATVGTTIERLRSAPETASAAERLLDLAALVRDRHPVNPTHLFWETLLDRAAPFVKRDLVLFNPQDIPTLSRLPDALARFPAFDPAVIVEDARSVVGAAVPLL